jgi:hypothetical protein
VLPQINCQSFDQIRSEIFARVKDYCPDWDLDQSSDPAHVFIELFSWLAEQNQFRLAQHSQQELLRLLKALAFTPRPAQCARVECQFVLTEDAKKQGRHCQVLAGAHLAPLNQSAPTFSTIEKLDVIPVSLSHVVSVEDGHVHKHNVDQPWTAFCGHDPLKQQLYLQDPSLPILLDNGVVNLTAQASQSLSLTDWTWELWTKHSWQGLTTSRKGESIQLSRANGSRATICADREMMSELTEQLEIDQPFIRATAPGRDRLALLDLQSFLISTYYHGRCQIIGTGHAQQFCYASELAKLEPGSQISAAINGLESIEGDDTLFRWELSNGQHNLVLGCCDGDGVLTTGGGPLKLVHWSQNECVLQFAIPDEETSLQSPWTLKLILQRDYGEITAALVEVLSSSPLPWPESLELAISSHSSERKLDHCLGFDGHKIKRLEESPFTILEEFQKATIYWAFDNWFATKTLSLYIDLGACPALARGPEIVWELWNGERWLAVKVQDGTSGLASSGVLKIPGRTAERRELFGQKQHWLRSRIVSGSWIEKPRVVKVTENVAHAVEGESIHEEPAGQGDGVAALTLKLKRGPVSALLSVISKHQGSEPRIWQPVPDFLDSRPSDAHFVFDIQQRQLSFGDGRQGRIPEAGSSFQVSYKICSGGRGNIAKGLLALSNPSDSSVSATNLTAASGGLDQEGLRELLRRAPGHFQSSDRAVTRQDFERLTKMASPYVAMASVSVEEGIVIVRVIPKPGISWSIALRDQIQSFLNARKLLTTRFTVEGPRWLDVSVSVTVQPESHAHGFVYGDLEDRLTAYFEKQSFGATLTAADGLVFVASLQHLKTILSLQFSIGNEPPASCITLPANVIPHLKELRIKQA